MAALKSVLGCAFFALSLIAAEPTFYRDVLPILQQHCQVCHRRGEIAPIPFESYEEVRPYAAAIREMTARRAMPPWFADPSCGRFSNDPSLTADQIATLGAWAEVHAPRGEKKEAPAPVHWTKSWNIDQPDAILQMPKPITIPASGEVSYTYVVIPTGFRQDQWVQMSEIRPGNRAIVHHAVAYIRDPQSNWLRNAPVGQPFSAGDLADVKLRRDAMWTTNDILLVYAPGSSPDRWRPGFAKLVPAGSDIVLQMHYTTTGKQTEDQTSVGLVFSKSAVLKRVLTLQLTNDHLLIPPGDPNHRVQVQGTIPNDARLLSFFPHMHLRGKTFEYNLLEPGKPPRTLLRIPDYNFYWQLSYQLTDPIELKAGTILQAVASFDNSKNNPHNPDPEAVVKWGEQTSEEMMVGFFDVAVNPDIDKSRFFRRGGANSVRP